MADEVMNTNQWRTTVIICLHVLTTLVNTAVCDLVYSLGHNNRVELECTANDLPYSIGHMNYYMSKYLSGGVTMTWLHYNGSYAKRTKLRNGPTELEITDGADLLKIFYLQGNRPAFCRQVFQPREIRTFQKKIRRDVRQMMRENRVPRTHTDSDMSKPHSDMTSKLIFHFLDNGSQVPVDLRQLLHFERLKSECNIWQIESEQAVMESENDLLAGGLIRDKRSLRDLMIMPGTLWCGPGQLARRYHELGSERTTDRCCRAHDTCKMNILPLQTRYGVKNIGFTVTHCRCDMRERRSIAESLRVPGTKWCGKGFSATKYSQLGGYSRTDRCCRMHDLRCPYWIGAMENKYGILNWRINTLMHCKCDERFRSCLKRVNTPVANMVGELFFNFVQTKCFILKPNKVCVKFSRKGKCIEKRKIHQAQLRGNLQY